MELDLLVPAQKEGSQMDAVADHEYDRLEKAILAYQEARAKLFDVNNWEKTCDSSATFFQLTDAEGTEISEIAEGALIRIDIPGPGTAAGDGYDWVKVEKIMTQADEDGEEWAGFTARPCPNPVHPEKGTAHFFSGKASSTFIVKRNGLVVTAEMHGRNELPNEDASGVFDGLRNVMVGYSAKIGLSYPQWKLLVDGLVEKVA